MIIAYKLTNRDLQTFNGHQWVVGCPFKTNGEPECLCSKGWIHFYKHPLLGLLMNPAHAGIEYPRLFECECSGSSLHETFKSGCTELVLKRELVYPDIPVAVNVHFAIIDVVREPQPRYSVASVARACLADE